MKVTCKIARRVGLDSYEKGRDYQVEPERAGKYHDYFTFMNGTDEAEAIQAFADRQAADEATRVASLTPAFSLNQLAQAVASVLQGAPALTQKGGARA